MRCFLFRRQTKYRIKFILLALISFLFFFKLGTRFPVDPPSFKPVLVNYSLFKSSRCYFPFIPSESRLSLANLNPHPSCSKPDWVLLAHNATLIYNKAYLQSKNIEIKQCFYSTFNWSGDDFTIKYGKRKNVVDGQKLDVDEEFFYVECQSENYEEYRGAFARIFKKKIVKKKRKQPINVFMLGLDSVSRENWIKKLTNSSSFLIKHMNSTVMNGYNIVGDGTPAALIPILTGKHEHELPNANKGFDFVDRVYPFIWKEFEERLGYATMFNEDWPQLGTFQYRLSGMSLPPTTHYVRPFQLGLYETGLFTPENYCLNSKSNFEVNINYANDFMQTYKESGFFGLTFLNQYSHDNDDNLNFIDSHMLHFLATFKKDKSISSSTILILFSDHGARYGSNRKSVKGLLHERNPFLSIYLPDTFKKRYPDQTRNLQENFDKISTPMDLYDTLKNLLELELNTEQIESLRNKRSTSLFKSIPASRNCDTAGVDPHWCLCLKRTELKVDASLVKIAQVFIEYLNEEILSGHLDNCERLELDDVNKVFLLDSFVNTHLADNRKKSTNRNFFWAFLDSWKLLQEVPIEIEFKKFQFQVSTKPNGGLYEFTVTSEPTTAGALSFKVEAATISRINAYGNSAWCIADRYPDLRKFCSCKNF